MEPIQIGAAIFDWPLWGQYNPRWATSPRYQHLIGSAANREASTSDNALHRMLMDMPQEERLDTITGVLIDLVAATMHLPKCKIDRKQSLINIGIDSLMAMELQTAIEKQIGSRISTLELLKGNAIEQLAALMLPSSQIAEGRADIEGQDTSVQNDTPGTSSPIQKGTIRLDYRAIPNPRTLLGHLNELTDEEVDSLLSDLFQEAEVEG